jgi:genome maintenance exonuclease 1|tara:strand:+ start:3284 stop:3970 length:687 start_codon:yes stop_codon:yes gene_type:complete
MSLIVEKYDYQPISRKQVEGKRLYATPDGNAVASVTTILDATKDKSHLIAWRKRVGEKKAQEIVTEASSVGTRMHKYLEDYVETGEWPTPGSNPYAQQAHGMAKVIKDQVMDDVVVWGSEVNLYMPQMYAGTTDLVGTYKGQPAIMDFKQTNKPKKLEWVVDYFLQLTAYAEAHNEIYGTEIRQGHVFMCSRAGEYQQFDIWPDEYDEWRTEWYNRVYQFYEQQAKLP